MPRPRLLALPLLAVLTAASTVPAAAQPNERELYVSVLDAKGAPVAGLQPDDFIVREDGLPREVLRVSRATEPMQIALLVDNSQAVSREINDLRRALTAFIKDMAGDNEIALITFGERPTIAQDYTTSAPVVTKAANRLFPIRGSGAYLLDALFDVTRGIRRRESTRPVIVAVLSEGVEFSNRHHAEVVKALAESGAAFHAVVLTRPAGATNETDEIRNRNVVLAEGTRATGGRRDNLLTSMGLTTALGALATELKNQYKVVYGSPRGLVPPERVEVSAKKEGLTARGTLVRPPQKGAPR